MEETEEAHHTETTQPQPEQTLTTANTRNKTDAASSSPSSRLSVLSDTPILVKRKRGRPRKSTSANTPLSKHLVRENPQQTSSFLSESTEDLAEGDTDSEVKPKRNRRSKVLHDDYVADFNTSDEEEGGEVFRRFSGRGRGRGRGLKYEFPDAFEDFFSSYNEFFGKQSLSGDESADRDIFKDLDECGDGERSLPKEDMPQGTPRGKTEGSVTLEGVLGQNGQTHVQIVNSGDTTMIDGKENLIYNIITTTGETKTVTPLVIPKINDDVGSAARDITPSSSGKTDSGEDKEAAKSILGEESNRSSGSSGEVQDKQHMDRALLQQVASLKHKYYQALQELKKRPQVATLADLVYSAANFLTQDQLVFFALQLKSGCPNVPGIKFSVREKMLALAIYLESPTLYKWLSAIFHLPSKLILERWLEGVARTDPEDAKKIVYNVYTRHIFKA